MLGHELASLLHAARADSEPMQEIRYWDLRDPKFRGQPCVAKNALHRGAEPVWCI